MEFFLILLAVFLSFMLVIISIPPILRVAREKKLFDTINNRKIHTTPTPPLGGVAIFIGFVLSTIIATNGYSFESLKYIVASIILMFFIGLKDDLLAISARKKIVVQLFAAMLLILLGNLQITNLHGIFGVYQIHSAIGVLLTLFIILAIVNAYNLIDGIDGLGSGLAIFASSLFGWWFFIVGQFQFAIMSFALTGSLMGFFLFNVFGKRNKLFMGDAGSLVIGLIISAIIIKFNEFNIIKTGQYSVVAAPAVSFSLVMVPLIDTFRVITIRLWNKKSPFHPDNNHIHHRLLALVPSHLKVTIIIIIANIFLMGFALLLNNLMLNVTFQFLAIFLFGIFLSFVPSMILRIKHVKMPAEGKIVKHTS
ncbi:MraY family glycosyltransferase [Tangfeifania diversioriginum]|nr:MraY family glycosyltransferase [Tangfeifania diversioriginum]